MAKDLASAAGSARGNAADGWQQGAMLDGATAGRGEEGSAVRGGRARCWVAAVGGLK